MSEYASVEYWNQRYDRENQTFEWLQSYHTLKSQIFNDINENSNILIIGCGNSRLAKDIIDYTNAQVTCIDFSTIVIKQMQQKYGANPNIKYECMDAKKLDFINNTFDLIIDKAMSDAVLCGESGEEDLDIICQQVSRVLKPNGKYIVISYANSKSRLIYWDKVVYNWVVNEPIQIPKPPISDAEEQTNHDGFHYIYIMTKKNV